MLSHICNGTALPLEPAPVIFFPVGERRFLPSRTRTISVRSASHDATGAARESILVPHRIMVERFIVGYGTDLYISTVHRVCEAISPHSYLGDI